MAVVALNLSPDRTMLRQFGFIAAGGFGLLALMAWRGWMLFGSLSDDIRGPVTWALIGAGGFSLLASVVFPLANKPIYLVLTVLTFPIGFVLSHVIMGILFFLIIGPIGAGLRLFGGDPMTRAADPKATSYWSDARPARPREDYFKQF